MGVVIVNGREIEIDDAERLNGVQAAARAGVEIPHYCWHPGLSVVASCRMCLVEVGRRDPATGRITMNPKLVPACQTPAVDGTVFVTDSPKVREARAMVEEDLLIRHPVDCPICDKAGECLLQDYYQRYGRAERRADIKPFTSRRRPLGETISLFVDRCILCSRCVRFCREVAGAPELMIVNRGAREEIDVFPGRPLANPLAGNVVDLCPVGALADLDFLYRQRVWFMRRRPSVCPGCARGCSIYVDQNQDRIYRIKPRPNPHVNRWWICDEGRYGWKHVHDPRRVTAPAVRKGADVTAADWSDLPGRLDRALRGCRTLAAVLSPFLTVEEAYLLAEYVRGIDPQAALAVGPAPRRGEDQSFPGGFVISAEKCPNRRGVEEVIAGLTGAAPLDWEHLVTERLARDPPEGVWISGGYPEPWHDEQAAARFHGVGLVVVQDLFPSPLMRLAHFQLPAAAFAEREGSYVNHGDRLQSLARAVRPPAGVWPEGWLLWRLTGRPGLYDARAALRELAERLPAFSAAWPPPPETGVDLKVNRLA